MNKTPNYQSWELRANGYADEVYAGMDPDVYGEVNVGMLPTPSLPVLTGKQKGWLASNGQARTTFSARLEQRQKGEISGCPPLETLADHVRAGRENPLFEDHIAGCQKGCPNLVALLEAEPSVREVLASKTPTQARLLG